MEDRRFTEEVFRIRITIKIGEWKVHVLKNPAFSGGQTQAWQMMFAGFVHKLNVV